MPRVYFHRHLTGQTPFGIFHNIFTRNDGPGRYLTVHCGTLRLEVYWHAPWTK